MTGKAGSERDRILSREIQLKIPRATSVASASKHVNDNADGSSICNNSNLRQSDAASELTSMS